MNTKWMWGILYCAIGISFALLDISLRKFFAADDMEFRITGWVLGIVSFGAGLIMLILAFRDSSLKRNRQSLAFKPDDKLVDAICAIIEPDSGPSEPADITAEVPVIEGKEEAPDKGINPALAKAYEVAKNSWKVVQVVLVLNRNDQFRAMVTLRSTVDNSFKALDISPNHDYGEEFFCLEQGQEIKLLCDGTNFNPVHGYVQISADYLRVAKKDCSGSFTLEYESERHIGLGE